jgi:hypothetical protein
MRKIKLVICLLTTIYGLFTFGVTPVKASLLSVTKNGEIVWKVLASEDSITLKVPERGSLEVKEVTPIVEANLNDRISLKIENGKSLLSVVTNEGEKNLDVTNTKDGLIEIEERPKAKSVKIGIINNQFSIQQEGITAITVFPITIDPKTADISIKTTSGDHFLTILPADAYQSSLKAKIITNLANNNLSIEEKKLGEISYEIEGKKKINFLNFFAYDFPVKVSVSALTGEILGVEQPVWQKVISFIFNE